MQTVRQLASMLNVLYVIGVALFARWLLGTSLGRKALIDSPSRRNRMPWYAPLGVFFVWLSSVWLIAGILAPIIDPLEGWMKLFVNNLILCAGAVVTIVLALVVARLSFARGLKGFGLRLRTMPKDLGLASVDLLAVWPLVLAMTVFTMVVGKTALGPDFEMPRHVGLELVTESTALPLQVLVVVLAVVVAPIVEELLFRGLFQTTIRSYLGQPWPAVVIASALFASVHENVTHWPSLFVLSVGLGYGYEKNGSLLRPIFMHALFNGITIVAALAELQAHL